ncbi:MAG: M48 family metalloprotease, partial [Planctomycetota bacterium]
MGSLVAVLAAIFVHAAAQSGYASDVEIPGALGPGLFLPYALSFLSKRAALMGNLSQARAFATATEASGWVSYAILVLGCGWLETVRRWTGSPLGLESWPDLALAISFAPFVVYQLLAIDATVRAHGGTATTRRHLRAFQTRMFAASAAPIAVFVAASAALGTNDWLRAQVEHVGLASALFTVAMVALLAWLLPTLLRWSWDTVSLPPGPVRDLLARVAERAQFTPRDVRMWRTGDLMANAAIVGFGQRGRTVFFSDHLLSILNARELCAVYAHEIGHARRRHVGAFIAWLAAFVLFGDLVVRRVLDVGPEWAAALAGGGLFLAWYVSFGWLSRRYELDADLFSLDVLGDLPALVSALERVGGRLRDVSGWRHFSVAKRVRFLERADADPAFATAFRSRLRVFRALGYGLAAIGAALQLASLAGDLPRDRAVAGRARGRDERGPTRARPPA